MPFAIVAEFPQGIYYGHVGEGQLDPLPSIDRVHSALLAAAGQGTRAVEGDNGGLHPSEDDLRALEWLENTPPDGLALPNRTVNRPDSRAYRDLGLLKPRLAGIRKVPKRDHNSVAIGGSLIWVWEQDPPVRVRTALEDLCPDVSYLGQADSPVRMRVESAPRRTVTHRRDPEARISTSRSTDVDLTVPRPGRTNALIAAHAAVIAGRDPSLAQDRARSDESEERASVVLTATGRERYVPLETRVSTPWESYWIVPFRGDRVRADERVAFAVALHRTLVAKHGADAPPLLTGNYADAGLKPANRLAIHVIDDDPGLTHRPGTPQAFVVAVPHGANADEVRAVADALASAREVRALRRSVGIDAGSVVAELDASRFWTTPPESAQRVWQVLPAVVETRSQGGRWNLADAVTLSVALVWRDELTGSEWSRLRGEQRYRALVARARERGVEVLSARPIDRTTVDRYVHRVPEGLMPLPYEARILLGDLEPSGTAFVAIGQSRHLGGGRLLPLDLSRDVVDTWRTR